MSETGGEELLAEITRQADAERQKLLEQTRTRVDGIRAETEAELGRLETETARTVDALRALERERVLGQVRSAERRRLLEVRRAGLRTAFGTVRERLDRLYRTDEYPAVLGRLIEEALAAAGEAGELLVAGSDVREARAVLVRLGVDCPVTSHGDEPGTVIVASQDGLRRIDNGLATRLRNAERMMEPETARLLFGTPEAGSDGGLR